MIAILQDSDFPLHPSRLVPLLASLQIAIALSLFVGKQEMERCYADIKGCVCMLVNMRARGISDGIRNHKISADMRM